MLIGRAALAAMLVVALSSCSRTTSGTPARARVTQAQAQAALLTAADLGAGFVAGTFIRRDRPPLCAAPGSPSFRQRTSPLLDVGTTLDHAAPRAALGEQIFGYADPATARRALSLGAAGLNCATGTVYYADGTTAPIHITHKVDVSSDLAVDAGFAWQLRNNDLQGAQVAVAVGSLVVVLGFQAVTGADTSRLPELRSAAKIAIAKVKRI